MNFLEIVGTWTIAIVVLTILFKVYRKIFPKKYTWKNCPKDHDTLARQGAVRCSKCGESFLGEDE